MVISQSKHSFACALERLDFWLTKKVKFVIKVQALRNKDTPTLHGFSAIFKKKNNF